MISSRKYAGLTICPFCLKANRSIWNLKKQKHLISEVSVIIQIFFFINSFTMSNLKMLSQNQNTKLNNYLLNGKSWLFLFSFTLFVFSCKRDNEAFYPKDVPESKRYGGQLIVGWDSDVANLNPFLNSSVNANDAFSLVFARLFVEVPQKNAVSLFEPYWVENFNFSSDSLSATFKLIDGVFWSDGHKSSAYDVQFSNQLMTDSDISDYVSSKLNIDSISVTDSLNFTVYYKTKNAYQLMDLNDGYIVPKHIFSGKTVEEIKKLESFNQQPVTNGPYKISEWMQNSYLKLVKNEGSPFSAYLSNIIFKITPDPVIRANQLLTGEIDLLPSVPDDFIDKISEDHSFKMVQFPYRSTEYIIFNLEKYPLNQKEFRIAIKEAIKIDSVTSIALGKSGFSLNTVFPNGFWANDTTQLSWEKTYNPLSSKNTIKTKFSDLKEITLKVASNQLPRQKAAYVIKNELAEIGININIEILNPDLLAKEVRSGDYDLAIWGTREGTKPDLSKRYFKSNIGKSNLTRFNEPQFEILHQEAIVETDPLKAYSDWVQLQKMIIDDAIIVPLFQRVKTDGVSRKIYQFESNSTTSMLKAWNWFIPEELQ